MKKFNAVIKTALLTGAALTATSVSASDKELLETLFQNGVLNKAQFEKLSKKADEKDAAAAAPTGISKEMAKAMDWASRVKISGDMRARYENIDNEEKIEKSRQRIRARLAIKAKVNDEVEAGFRLVTTGGRTSTNQSLGNSKEGSDGFKGKAIFFDRAFIKWAPEFAKGANMTVGKFKQPWYSVSSDGLIWDSDVNPEGLPLNYSYKIGPAKLTANGGYYILSDNGSEGHTFSEDLNMYHGGISGEMKFNDMVKASLGANAFIFNNNNNTDTVNTGSSVNRFAGDRTNGTGTKNGPAGDIDFKIYEVAGKVDINTGILPIKLYANYAVNDANNVKEGEDTAWLAGIATKWKHFKFDYNYRDTQRDAVTDTFNDSDFARGATGARGHKVKLSYGISKNFSIGGAYIAAEDYTRTAGQKINIDTFQLDLKAKF